MNAILQEIIAERSAQPFDAENDDRWTPGEWAALVSHFATRRVVGDLRTIDRASFRADMVKVAALAVACIEALDR